MKPQDRGALDGYYAASRSWAEDGQQRLRSSRRAAWIVAGVLAGVAAMEAVALVVLMPLKTVVPYTVMVDRTTGYVQALEPSSATKVSANAALVQSLLAQYVTARESFDVTELQANYRKVGLWSADAARAQYLSGMQPSNPASPLATYPRATTVDTQVKSISPLGPEVALIRFDTVRHDEGGTSQPPQPWAAVVRYRFSNAAMATADRFTNPLGFQVLRYRRDPEALTPPPVTSEDAANAPSPAHGVLRPAAGGTAERIPSSAHPEGPTAGRPRRFPPPRTAEVPSIRDRVLSFNQVPMGSPLDPPRGRDPQVASGVAGGAQ